MSKLINNELKISNSFNLTITDNKVDLTAENVAKVEAMIRYDSSYRKSSDTKAGPTKDYKGSTAYWINNFKKNINNYNDEAYRQIIKEIVSAIDRENSTHLNSDKIGIEEITNRIYKHPIKELLHLIKNPSPDYQLIKELSEKTNPTGASKKGIPYKGRENFSFATKFCHYMAFYIFQNEPEADNFSIYDAILDKAVRKYKDDFEIIKGRKVKIDFAKNRDYSKYLNFIDSIISELPKPISRNGFDHLLWYYYKGE